MDYRPKGWWCTTLVFMLFICQVFSATEQPVQETNPAMCTMTPNDSGSNPSASERGGKPEGIEDGYRMPGYLIAVIILAIFFATVVVYKLYKHIVNKGFSISCNNGGPQRNRLHRRDTNKPLISSESQSGSIYKKGSQREPPETV